MENFDNKFRDLKDKINNLKNQNEKYKKSLDEMYFKLRAKEREINNYKKIALDYERMVDKFALAKEKISFLINKLD